MLTMRSALLFICLFINSALYAGPEPAAEPDMAYLIIKATAINKDKQPSWICLVRRRKCTHVSANEGLVAIKPGKYKLHHIDFGKSKVLGTETQIFEKPMTFKFKPGNIYLVGDIQLKKKKSKRYKIELNQDPDLVIKACAISPDIFERYPVNNMTGSKKTRFSCKS
jgi:hypothetical protein